MTYLLDLTLPAKSSLLHMIPFVCKDDRENQWSVPEVGQTDWKAYRWRQCRPHLWFFRRVWPPTAKYMLEFWMIIAVKLIPWLSPSKHSMWAQEGSWVERGGWNRPCCVGAPNISAKLRRIPVQTYCCTSTRCTIDLCCNTSFAAYMIYFWNVFRRIVGS